MYLSILRYEQLPSARREKICFLDFVPSKLGCPISRGCILPPLIMAELAIGENRLSAETITWMVGRNTVIATIIIELKASSKCAPNRRNSMALIPLTVLESMIARALFEESMSSNLTRFPTRSSINILIAGHCEERVEKKRQLERSSASEISLDAT